MAMKNLIKKDDDVLEKEKKEPQKGVVHIPYIGTTLNYRINKQRKSVLYTCSQNFGNSNVDN